MARMQNPNLEILMRVVERLGALADEMVFLGGCATGLLITDPAAPPIRETRDLSMPCPDICRPMLQVRHALRWSSARWRRWRKKKWSSG